MKDQEPSEASGSQSAPEFRTVKNALEIPGIRERAAESLGRRLAAQYGVRVRRVADADVPPQEGGS